MANQIVRCQACGSANRVPSQGSGSPRCGKCRTPRLSQRFTVRAVPTLMIVKDGEVVDRRAGAAPPGQLRGWVEANLGMARDERSRT